MSLERIALALQRSPRAVAWAALAAWLGFLYFMSSQSPPEPRPTSTVLRSWFMNLRHAPAFGLAAVLFAWVLARRGTILTPTFGRVALAVVLATLYGLTDELHQSSVPGRDASIWDLLTDFTGACFALALLHALERGRPWREYVPIALWGVPACLAASFLATFHSDSWPR